MINFIRKCLLLAVFTGLVGCAATDSGGKYKLKQSIFEGEDKTFTGFGSDDGTDTRKVAEDDKFKRVKSMAQLFGVDKEKPKVAATFSAKEKVKFSVDAMQLSDFIHNVFGKVLGVNYVVDNTLTQLSQPITLNFQNLVSKREAFLAASDILTRQEIGVSVKDKVYYLYPMETKTAGEVSIGVGSQLTDLPLTTGKVLQIVPMEFGVNIGIERTLRQLSDIAITVDFDKSAVFLQGDIAKVKQAMELARILDMPSSQGKYIGLLRLVYLSSDEFASQLSKLMAAEGIPVGVGDAKQKNVVLVPLNQVGLVAAFASNESFLKRVEFWHLQLDRPSEGDEKRYFMYEPQNARARDLGESLSPLFGGSTATPAPSQGNSSRDTRSALRSQVSAPTVSTGATAVEGKDLTMVIDERTNTLIFYTTGLQYQKLQPLIKRMDTLPRQVILEATIAEVTLTDEFKHGVEFAVNNGSFGASTTGAFNTSDIGGLGLNWARTFNDSFSANLIKTNSLVNVLSSPTLLVRDGVSATIVVGNEIPLVSSTISDPLAGNTVQRTTIERRQIGLNLSVTPTINSQGIVIMEITLEISNQLPTGDGSTLLNRLVKTEVVANSGQTVILAGLISETTSNGDKKIPGLGDIPGLGHLFKSANENKDKTELVILVTPKIIHDGNQWGEIKNKFRKGLENVEF